MRAYRSRYTGEQMDSLLGQVSGKQDALTFDTTPTSGSTHPVTSDGVYTALSGKQDELTFDTVPTSDSTHPVTSGGVYTALSGKADSEDIGAANGIAPLNDSAKVADTYLPKYAGSSASGGTANKASSIPFGQVDSTSTATVFTATVDGITELRDGVCCYLRNGVVTSASGFTININDLGAKPVYSTLAAATRSTTIFNVNYTMLFVYNSSRVEDGCWDVYYGYDSNTNTIGYQLRTNSYTLPAKFKTYRYRLLFTSADGDYFVGANSSTSTNATTARTPTTEKIDPFGPIVYYGSTTVINANANFGATVLWSQYTITLGYSFNNNGGDLTLAHPKPVYVKCDPQDDGSVKINASAPYVQALPSTEDGHVYIFLGVAYSATAIELLPNHPVYYYKDGQVRLWTNPVVSSGTTVSRPTAVQVGEMYFDTTLGRPVWVSSVSGGTVTWVDATGTTV